MHQLLLLSSVGAKFGAERVHPVLIFREEDCDKDRTERFSEGLLHMQSMFDASHKRVYITCPAAGQGYGSDFTLECCALVWYCCFLLVEVYSPLKSSIKSFYRKASSKASIENLYQKPSSKAFIDRLIFYSFQTYSCT